MSIFTALRWLPLLSIVVLGGSSPAAVANSQATAAMSQATDAKVSELRLDASLIEDFLRSIYFADDGRFHFREYSTCSYEFLQNPIVSVEDDLVLVSAEFFRRRGTETLGRCVGGPGVNTTVTMSARLSAQGSAVAIEIIEVKTETLPKLTSVILGLAGVKPPMTHEFDLMAAMNRVLHGQQSFGVSSLVVHDVLPENGSVLLRLTMQLGVWRDR